MKCRCGKAIELLGNTRVWVDGRMDFLCTDGKAHALLAEPSLHPDLNLEQSGNRWRLKIGADDLRGDVSSTSRDLVIRIADLYAEWRETQGGRPA